MCRAGADINALGFVFLRTPQSAVLTNVTYAGLPTNQVTYPLPTGLLKACSAPDRYPEQDDTLCMPDSPLGQRHAKACREVVGGRTG